VPQNVPPCPTDAATTTRVSLAILTDPGQANAFGLVHGGVVLRLADECGASAALRYAGGGRVATAAIDSLTFIGPVHVGERVEVMAEVTHVGRTSIEVRLEVTAEPMAHAERRKVAEGYGLYVALDETGRPRPVPSLPIVTEADRRRAEAAQARQAIRLARRHEATHPSVGPS
jgi:acyl-CoA thioesterase YciA